MKNKICIAAIVISLIIMSMALAETQVSNTLISPIGGTAQGGTAFTFIGSSGQPVASTWRYGTIDTINYNVPSTIGSSCNIGEYIVAYQCPAGTTSFSTSCTKMFSEDWLRSSTTDLLPYAEWKNVGWFHDMFYKYNMPVTYYQCLRAKEDVQVKANGKFTSINYPSSASTSSSITVTGTFYVTQTGPFILESNIDPGSKTSFSVITSTKSPCDGSAYYSGSRVNGVAGNSYNFQFTMKAPPEAGRYNLNIYTYTDCAKNGGEEIQTITRTIDIKGASANCNLALSSKQTFIQGLWNVVKQTSIGDLNGCTYEAIRQYCGTKDTDSDGVPDNCDYCPLDKGDPTSPYVGCHPCYGKDPSTTDGAACWNKYSKTYTTPDTVQAILNPVVGIAKTCDGFNLLNFNVYKDGTRKEVELLRQNCLPKICETFDTKSAACTTGTKTECINSTALCQGAAGFDGSSWICTDVLAIKNCAQGCIKTGTTVDNVIGKCGEDKTTTTTASSITKTGTYTDCLNGNVAKYQKYSDGSNTVINDKLIDCSGNGCTNGACNQGTTCNGGQTCPEEQNPAIIASDSTCAVDSDCPSGQKCDSTKQCIEMALPTACKTNADCKSTEGCHTDIGVCMPPPECIVNADCGAGKQCAGEKCIDALVETNSSNGNELGTCTVDQTQTCDNGAVIITAKCVNGKLESGDNKCSQETSFFQNLFGTPAEKSTTTSSATTTPNGLNTIIAGANGSKGGTNWLLIAGVAIVLVVGFLFIKKTGPKKHKKK